MINYHCCKQNSTQPRRRFVVVAVVVVVLLVTVARARSQDQRDRTNWPPSITLTAWNSARALAATRESMHRQFSRGDWNFNVPMPHRSHAHTRTHRSQRAQHNRNRLKLCRSGSHEQRLSYIFYTQAPQLDCSKTALQFQWCVRANQRPFYRH